MYYIDSHTHLNAEQLYPEYQIYFDEFVKIWWLWMVVIWMSKRYDDIAKEIYSKLNRSSDFLFWYTSWVHPYEVVSWNIEKIDDVDYLSTSVKQSWIVWIWECWIDLHYENSKSSLLLQQEIFDFQCNLSKESWLPIVIHSRSWFNETIDILKNYPDLKIYFHCRWYWKPEYIKLLDKFRNLKVGFCGNITYKNAVDLRETLSVLKKEHLLLETDAPYLSPQKFRWQINQPKYITETYDFVANYLDIDLNELQKIVFNNFKALYFS